MKRKDFGLREISLHGPQDPLQTHCRCLLDSNGDTADDGSCQLEQGEQHHVGSGTFAEHTPGLDSVWPNVTWEVWGASDGADLPVSAGGATELGPPPSYVAACELIRYGCEHCGVHNSQSNVSHFGIHISQMNVNHVVMGGTYLHWPVVLGEPRMGQTYLLQLGESRNWAPPSYVAACELVRYGCEHFRIHNSQRNVSHFGIHFSQMNVGRVVMCGHHLYWPVAHNGHRGDLC